MYCDTYDASEKPPNGSQSARGGGGGGGGEERERKKRNLDRSGPVLFLSASETPFVQREFVNGFAETINKQGS